MTVAEINALLYSSDHPRDRLARALRIERAVARMARLVRRVVAQRHRCRWRRKRGARAGGGGASGCAGISFARGDGDRSRVGRRPVADAAEPRRSAAARGAPGPIRGPASSANARRRGRLRRSAGAQAALSQLLAFGSPLDAALSHQREDRAGQRGWNLPARACPSRRCARRQRAARQLHSAIRSERPVVLLSAGIGATPVLAMLHALAATRAHTTGLVAPRRSRWAASSLCRRSPPPHARAPARPQLRVLQRTGPGRHDDGRFRRGRPFVAVDFRRGRRATRRGCLHVRADALHGTDMKEALATLGVAPERIHVELFSGSESMTPGVVGAAPRAPHLPKDDAGSGPLVSFARSGIAAHWNAVVLSRTSWSWPKRATSPFAGRAAPACVTTARAGWCRARSSTDRSRSTAPADGNLLVCCSQPLRDIVIDL